MTRKVSSKPATTFDGPIDWLVITAANPVQAAAYETQLRERQREGGLSLCRRWLVVPDLGGRRIGSGAATIAALAEVVRHRLAESRAIRDVFGALAGQRILAIHSGGDSRRLPAYAAQGKLFLPLPRETREGRPATLFDLLLDDLASIELSREGRVLVASGDVVLGVAGQRVDINRPGVVGVAFKTDAARGSRHGVYVRDEFGRVTDFLQKPSESLAAARGAIAGDGGVLVDTGLVGFDIATAAGLLDAAGVVVKGRQVRLAPGPLADLASGNAPAIDLYEHMLMALVPSQSRREFQSRFGEGGTVFGWLHDAIAGTPFHVGTLDRCEFLHIGTTRELLEVVPRAGELWAPWRTRSRVVCFNSDVDRIRGAKRAVVECSDAAEVKGQGDDLVLVGWPDREIRPPSLPAGWGLCVLPVGKRDWSLVAFGSRDDFKTPAKRGGSLGNRPLLDALAIAGLTPADVALAPDADTSLWCAKLWTVGPLRDVLARSRWLWTGARASDQWRDAPKCSLAELVTRVNLDRLLALRAEFARRERLKSLSSRILGDRWLSAPLAIADVHDRTEAKHAARHIERAVAASSSPLDRARAHMLGDELVRSRLAGKSPGRAPWWRDARAAAFDAVADAVYASAVQHEAPGPAKIHFDQVIWVTTPVRIDFAGGWSDTPPICHELGGAVVNGAITLNAQYPVQVIARLCDKPHIRVSSVDLGESRSFTSASQLRTYRDPHDWTALAKAALVLMGITPGRGDSLSKRLAILGGGLELTLFSALPKGSGLGTSSVLGASILACLARLLGRRWSIATTIDRTSALEQMMRTGGGWQDQAGGITPGIKLVRTQPGPVQCPEIIPIACDASRTSELAGRTLLYYTGHRRMARDILHGVVTRYLRRAGGVRRVIDDLQQNAADTKDALAAGDIDGFARGVLRFWELKKAIDPGATNAAIESLIDLVKHELTGYELPGAGGGGFLFMIARDRDAAARVRRVLERRPPNDLARFYEPAIDPHGMSVSVL
ncbi:MAG: hypothetical protein JNL50_11710 [Phycisphaerae bacterium]|nr:hypothetical protein [Phycisphaerae bacterium]